MTRSYDDHEYEDYLREAIRRNLPPLKSSTIFLALYSENYERDAIAVLQFGLAVLLDKPIYILVKAGEPIRENVRRLARGIEEYHEGELEAASKRLLTKAGLL